MRRAWSLSGQMDRMQKPDERTLLLGENAHVTFRRHAWTLLEWRTALSKKTEQKGHAIDRANAILSVLFLVVHIFLTYQPPPFYEELCWFLEVVMALFFLLRLISLILIAFESSTVYYTLRSSFFIDIVTILPTLPFSFWKINGVYMHHHSYYDDLTPLNLAYPFRVIRAYYTLDRYLSGMEHISMWDRQVYHTYLVMSTILVFTASFIHQTPWIPVDGWHNAMFYTAVMGGTMGFLDPSNDIGRMVIMAFVITLMILVPMQIGALIVAKSKCSIHSAGYMGNSKRQSPHVVVCGYVPWPSITNVLRELLHHLHGAESHRDVVIVDPDEPSEGMEDMLTDPVFSRVFYIKGSPLETTILLKARLREAAALIVLSNKLGDPETEDAKVIMITALVASHTQTPVHAQIHLPENYDRVIRAGARVAFCLQDVKLSLAAKSCLCPGLPTLMCNLFRSFEAKDFPRLDGSSPWVEEYCKGMGNQIYCVPINDSYIGKEFMSVVVNVFLSLHAIIIGIIQEGAPRVLLNPGPHFIFSGTELVVMIAQKLSRARKVQDIDFGQEDSEVESPGCRLKRLASDPEIVISRTTTGDERPRTQAPEERTARRTETMQRPKWLKGSYGGIDISTSVAAELDCILNTKSPIPCSPFGEPASPTKVRQDNVTFSNVVTRLREEGCDEYWDTLSPYFAVFHPCDRPCLKDVMVDTYAPTDQAHIIVTGDVFPLFPFLLPLRSKHGDRHHPILFLYSHFPEAEWAAISLFPQVYVMIGSITKGKDLQRASVSTAHRVLILNAPGKVQSIHMPVDVHSELLEDKNAVMGLLAIEEQLQDWSSFSSYAASATLPIVELRHRRSLMLLRPQMAMDTVRMPCAMNFAPRFAAGLALTNMFYDAFLADSVYNAYLPEIVNQLLSNAPTSAYLTQVRCPPTLVGKPFSALFIHKARRHIVAIGLYRVAHGTALLPYVYTNPAADTILRKEDLIFVLKRGHSSF